MEYFDLNLRINEVFCEMQPKTSVVCGFSSDNKMKHSDDKKWTDKKYAQEITKKPPVQPV